MHHGTRGEQSTVLREPMFGKMAETIHYVGSAACLGCGRSKRHVR
jgi:hypothetical protein